jgi:hypothetical protein
MWWYAIGLPGLAAAGIWLGSCDPPDPEQPDSRSGGNLKFGSCAQQSQCGGDPEGVWSLVSGCVGLPSGGWTCSDGATTARGQGSGTLIIQDGSFNLNLKVDIRQCGAADEGGATQGGLYTLSGSSLNLGGSHAVDFCVTGDTLTLRDNEAVYPDLTSFSFNRAR